MKLSELVIGTDYAVIPSWYSSSQSARDVNKVREDDVVKGVLQSKDKYVYNSGTKRYEASDFQLAPEGERSVGVLVKGQNSHGNDIYWTARLADIVAPYDDLTPRWDKEKEEAELARKEEEELREKIAKHNTAVHNQVNLARESLPSTCKELLGENCQVTIEKEGWDLGAKAIAQITLTELQRLLELAYEGMEVRKSA